MGRAVLPPSLLSGLRWPSPGVHRLYCRAIGNLQENLHWDISPRNTATSSPVPVVGLCQHTPQKKTLRHSHVGLAQSPVGSVFLSFQPWCAQSFVYVCQEWCLCFPQSCEGSWSQIPLAFKIRFPGHSQPLGCISWLGSLMWGLGPSQQCKDFFDVIVL